MIGIEKRIGTEKFKQRIYLQTSSQVKLPHQGERFFRLEQYIPIDKITRMGLKATGMHKAAYTNFLNVKVVNQEWKIRNLPPKFEGFRIMQLSDLHADLDTQLTNKIIRQIQNTKHDAAVITGDFRNKSDGPHEVCVSETAKIVAALHPRRWGILGNHDNIEMTSDLEKVGLPILLNEVVSITKDRQKLWIAGIDDPHFYKTHDLGKVRKEIPANACAVLLSHSPEVYKKAAELNFDLQLSGHTHGGQLCLPTGRHIVVPLPKYTDKKIICGRWSHNELQGYTSPGTGSCAIAARMFCPPEITIHILSRSS